MKFKIRLVNEEEELQAFQNCNEHESTARFGKGSK